MKRLFSLLIFSCAVAFASAQEKVIPDSIPQTIRVTDAKELLPEMPLLLKSSFSERTLNLLEPSLFNQPLLPDFSKNLDFKKYFNQSNISAGTYNYRFGLSPFYANGVVFNQAEYKMNNRFSFGGNSFGAQTIFDMPQMNPAIQNMSTKGASMFMQYKVSKNFKIETRVSVTNHQSPWGP